MKLLFDENLSPKLVAQLAAEFPQSVHIDTLGLRGHADAEIRAVAAARGYLLVTKDSDFLELTLLHGHPPKVVWLRVGNSGTLAIAGLLRRNGPRVAAFAASAEESLLELSGSDA